MNTGLEYMNTILIFLLRNSNSSDLMLYREHLFISSAYGLGRFRKIVQYCIYMGIVGGRVTRMGWSKIVQKCADVIYGWRECSVGIFFFLNGNPNESQMTRCHSHKFQKNSYKWLSTSWNFVLP